MHGFSLSVLFACQTCTGFFFFFLVQKDRNFMVVVVLASGLRFLMGWVQFELTVTVLKVL